MAAVNGVVSPPEGRTLGSPSPSTGVIDNKRKREEREDAASMTRNARTQGDILQILKQHDTKPSFLQHDIDNDEIREPSPKKARLSHSSKDSSSISSKLVRGAYATLQGLKDDAVHVSRAMVTFFRNRTNDQEGLNAGRLSVEDLKQIQRVRALEQVIRDVVEQEMKYETAHDQAEPKHEMALPNGHMPDTQAGANRSGGMVLTLFGNAPTPKQLFSSMQNPPSGQEEPTIKTELPIEEMSLPNGLTATQIMPAEATRIQKGPTFEDAFSPAYNLPPLHPPKTYKRSTTRDTIVAWEFKDHLARSGKKGGYTTQSLTVSDWLGYGGTDSKEDPESPQEKRKQRDRALSSGESTQPPPSKLSLEEALAKEEETLFRKAYSSFAPSCDNSKALVSDETKNMVWWQKVGDKRYNETFAIDPALLDDRPTSRFDLTSATEKQEPSEEDFTDIVDQWRPPDEDMPGAEPVRDNLDVNQVLQRITDLLETLASHQRIRNASLPSSTSASRTTISPAPTLASRIGRPDSPAEDEIATYKSLKRELAYLVLKLPPYAVAKLHGEQLSELGVSRIITFEGKDLKGSMEEDQVSRMAKYTAMATAAGIASLNRNNSSTNQHYSSTSQRTPAIGQAANTRYGQSANYGPTRTPVPQPAYQRQNSTQPTYSNPSATAPRPGYGQPNQYARTGAPQTSYGHGQYYQRPTQTTSGYGGYNQQLAQSSPQTQPRQVYSSAQPLAQYQQRAAQNAVGYQTKPLQQSPSPFNQHASPIKPANYNPSTQLPQASIQRPAYSNPQQQYQQPQPHSGKATPSNFPVNDYQRPPLPPDALRAASGTPQPPQLQPQPQTQAQQVQTNGHADTHDKDDQADIVARQDSIASSETSNAFICAYCQKTFTKPSNYAVHLRSHTGERPFACTFSGCGKDFAVRSNLNRHMRVRHNAEADGCSDDDANDAE